jgi:chromosome segregation ATPase
MGDGPIGLILQLAIAIAGGGLVGTVVTALAQRRKIAAEANRSGADASAVLASSALELLGPWREQVDQLSRRLSAVQDDLGEADRQVGDLRDRLAQAMQENARLQHEVAVLRSTLQQAEQAD